MLLLRSSLGQTMEVLGEYREAEQLYFGLMGQLESLYGPQSPELQSIQIRSDARPPHSTCNRSESSRFPLLSCLWNTE